MKSPRRITLELARKSLGPHPDDPEAQRVVDHIERRTPISQDVGDLSDAQDNFWDRLADSVARIGGSWGFIGAFFLFLVAWTSLNSVVLTRGEVFDPYPYIFLNLMLSMLAAIQAPIIMMSQNRQAEKDRLAAAHDYEVNLRSELEILGMQEKLDHLRGEQHDLILEQQARILDQLGRIEARLG
ncbi:DUF1003 domain-containing protein [Stakelama pacifica]|uniref:Putative membrane protein n=1 Tax=Stakelama pacifica TaxID=517720 RepID=A0A4R6FXB6_9SPHN|nr:DUF1003 domain-containing protein [Stakelama pacifica]TDN86437.1 putative membrane protein [Stakelama pacifica]GGO89640.1 cyclic nucleotide-binding protein [Stakelama pacifica]